MVGWIRVLEVWLRVGVFVRVREVLLIAGISVGVRETIGLQIQPLDLEILNFKEFTTPGNTGNFKT